jgi:hypothetical protein
MDGVTIMSGSNPVLDFPDSPAVNDEYSLGDYTYTWNGVVWNKLSTLEHELSRKVNRDGDTMLDALKLPPGNPVDGYDAAHKNYVDSRVSGVSIGPDAPGNPTQGMLWWDNNSGSLYIYYDDDSSQQWVQVA